MLSVAAGLFQAADREAFFVCFRITAAHKDHTTCRARVHDQCLFIEIACGCAFQQFHEVALDAEHHAFRFRVAHADVIFNHHRFAFYPDQSEEDEAFVDDVFFFQSVDGRFDDAVRTFSMYSSSANGTGVTLPIPPVLSPLSPSPIRL